MRDFDRNCLRVIVVERFSLSLTLTFFRLDSVFLQGQAFLIRLLLILRSALKTRSRLEAATYDRALSVQERRRGGTFRSSQRAGVAALCRKGVRMKRKVGRSRRGPSSDDRARSVRLLEGASNHELSTAEAQSDSSVSRGQRLALQHRNHRPWAPTAAREAGQLVGSQVRIAFAPPSRIVRPVEVISRLGVCSVAGGGSVCPLAVLPTLLIIGSNARQ